MKQGIILGLDRSGKTMLLHQLVEMTKNYRHISLASKIFSGKNFNKGQTREKSKVEIHSVGVNEDDYTNVSNNFERLGSNGRRSIVMPDFKPTVGVEHTTLSIDTRACTICEVGGQMLPMWKAYYGSCNFWIYVVDISVPTQIPQAALELFNIMRDEFMRDKPKLILLNKMDAPCSLSDQMLRAYLRFDELLSDNDTKSQVIKISALTGENMNTVLQWISHRMGMKVAPRYSIFPTTKQESRIYPS